MLASSKALLFLATTEHRGERAFLTEAVATLAAAGAVAGAVFTGLEPIRRRSTWGAYVGWVLSVYVILAIVVAAGVWHGDDPALLKEPAIIVFLVGTGAVVGIFCARVSRRWARGDFSFFS
ncbi:MAG TPA: hypothetical protein VN953_01590 [Gemmatimonadales bacterium]|nr:hypothetical protein [Gemmatimonadales bacterium]